MSDWLLKHAAQKKRGPRLSGGGLEVNGVSTPRESDSMMPGGDATAPAGPDP